MDWEGISYDGPTERDFQRWREEELALIEFESKAYRQYEDPGADCFDRTPDKVELEIHWLDRFIDESSYDRDGVVFP